MYAVIDIETTGGNYRWGRITEIAIFIHNGKEITEEYSTLINPEMPIPAFISQLTGISDEMVQDAPTFEEVAPEIARITEGMIFVAHNSQFDYHFVRHEFRRMGLEYERSTLCTVRLSRKIIPQQPSYSLGKLCSQLGIELQDRHRAGGDAAATVKLLELLISLDKEKQLQANIVWKQPESAFNQYLQNTKIEDIPQSPGILYLMGEEEELLYIDSTRNMRRQLLAHLNNKRGRATFNIRQKIKDVHFEETGTYLIAQLRAQEEVLRQKPSLNALPKTTGSTPKRWHVVPDLQLDGYLHLLLKREEPTGKARTWSSKKEALAVLEKLSKDYKLCHVYSALQSTAAPHCNHTHSPWCLGACRQQKASEAYNQRVHEALLSLEENNNQLILEKGRSPREKSLIKIENSNYVSWGYLSLEENTYNLSHLLDCKTIACHSPEAVGIAQKYILKNNVQQIISY
jgi:DNA polymerase-3 subunit epsilon